MIPQTPEQPVHPAEGRNVFTRLFVTLLAVACAVVIGAYAPSIKLPALLVISVFLLSLGVSFVRGTEGLYLVIFAMLFSPEISSGATTGRTAGEGGGMVTIRLEDLIMVAVVLGWMLRSAYAGKRHGIIANPVNPAIWIYMAVSVIATLLGLLGGSVRHILAGAFNNLKYFEYFLLYFMILAHVRDKKTVVRMIWALLIVFFLAMLFGYTQIGTGHRVSAPFDKEPNTFGGYMVLLMCVAAGIALVDKRVRIRSMMIVLIAVASLPFFFTLSRASYVAVVFGLLSFVALSHHRILITSVTVALVAASILGFPMFPEKVKYRIESTFNEDSQSTEKIGKVVLDGSTSARIQSYRQASRMWVEKPLFGYGVTGTPFMDAQYPRVLVETGIVGLLAFLFMLWRLLYQVWLVFRSTRDRFLRGAAMGFLCGVIAIMAHALGANSFIIIRIAEPFWLLAGLILVIPRVEETAAEQSSGSSVTPA